MKEKVFVISINGYPLMPTSQAKSRKLLRDGKAKVFKLNPFSIQLNFECEENVQEVTCGIDSGYQNIGFSCITEKEELVCGTLVLDGRTSSKLTERAMYRRGRRQKLRYRKPRFLNRTKPKGWLPPSTQRRYDTHINLINRLRRLLPITKVVVEVANFDIQKLNNPDISSTDYQQGDKYGYQNMRSYLLAREKGKCQICGKEFTKGNTSHIHHAIERSKSGSNKASNMVLLHKKCHENLHKSKKTIKISKNKSYKPNTFMSIIHNKFYNDVQDLEVTYGYITFVNRNEICLEKSHFTDAFIIAGGGFQKRSKPLNVKQKTKNNRCLQINRNGYKPSIRRQRYPIQPQDFIWISGKKYISKGCKNKGRYVIIDGYSKLYAKVESIERHFRVGTIIF